MAAQQLWLELQPMSASAPRRLMVFLHGAGSSPEIFLPVALAWQLKFTGATAVLLQGLTPAPGGGSQWFTPGSATTGTQTQSSPDGLALAAAIEELVHRVRSLQKQHGFTDRQTTLIGFSQGATLALEAVRRVPDMAAVVVSYAGQLLRPIGPDERIGATIHLIQGALDTVVLRDRALIAHRRLLAAGVKATLDLTHDGTHSIDQQMIILGTARMMQTVFSGRSKVRPSGYRLQ